MGRKSTLEFTEEQKRHLSNTFFNRLREYNCEHLTDVQIAKAIDFKYSGMIGYLRNPHKLVKVSSTLYQIINTLPLSKYEEMSEIKAKGRRKKGINRTVKGEDSKGSEFFRGFELKADKPIRSGMSKFESAVEDLHEVVIDEKGLNPKNPVQRVEVTIKFDMEQVKKIIGMLRFGDDNFFKNK